MPDIAARARLRLEGRIILFVIIVALAGMVAQCILEETSEDKILSDLKPISDGNVPNGIIKDYDHICFASYGYLSELHKDKERIGGIFASFNKENCSAKYPTLFGSSIPIIVLVRHDDIVCAEIEGFDFWIKEDKPHCISPNKLSVVKLTSPPISTGFSANGSFSPRRATFQIMEKE